MSGLIEPPHSANNAFNAYSSTDLTNWVDEGPIFDLDTDCSWASTSPWAPDMISRNGQYYFYYSAGKNTGVAVGPSPTGPFTDLGYPLLTNDPGVGDEIDPHPFIDDDGQAYLYYGGSGSTSKMGIRRLNQDMVSFTGSPTYVTLPNYVEGPYMIKRQGTYYLMYSTGNWQGWNYKVEYATASSPLGPFTYKGKMLYSVQTGLPDAIDEHGGPGHHSVLQMPGCDEYYVVYHRYEQKGPDRRTAIDRLYFNGDGTIKRVQMTNNGVLARPLSAACRPNPPVPSVSISDGQIYSLQDKAFSRYLKVSTVTANNVTTSCCITNDSKWKALNQGNGYWAFQNVNDGRYLKKSTSGSNSAVTSCCITDESKWQLVEVGGNYYNLQVKSDGIYLDADQADWNVDLNPSSAGNDKQWRFASASNARSGVVAYKKNG